MKITNTSNRSMRKQQQGVGLVEVLVAVIVLSIGFLAAARMQMAGMRSSQNAYFLSQANFMLRDMTDRMRANRAGVIANHYNEFITTAGTSEPNCITNGTKCTVAQLAQADLYAWSSFIHAPAGDNDFKPILPTLDDIAPKGEVVFNAAQNVYTVRVSWGEMINGESELQTLETLLTP